MDRKTKHSVQNNTKRYGPIRGSKVRTYERASSSGLKKSSSFKNEWDNMCLVLGSQTEELISKKACMSISKFDDMILLGSEQWFQEKSKHGYNIYAVGEGDRQVTFGLHKEGILGPGNLDRICGLKRKFTIVRIEIPGHVCCAIIKPEEKIIEFFDSAEFGSRVFQMFLLTMIAIMGKEYMVGWKAYNLSMNIQEQVKYPEYGTVVNDYHCQTWIYLFVMMRLVFDCSLKDVIALESVNAKQRQAIIHDFWDYLMGRSTSYPNVKSGLFDDKPFANTSLNMFVKKNYGLEYVQPLRQLQWVYPEQNEIDQRESAEVAGDEAEDSDDEDEEYVYEENE